MLMNVKRGNAERGTGFQKQCSWTPASTENVEKQSELHTSNSTQKRQCAMGETRTFSDARRKSRRKSSPFSSSSRRKRWLVRLDVFQRVYQSSQVPIAEFRQSHRLFHWKKQGNATFSGTDAVPCQSRQCHGRGPKAGACIGHKCLSILATSANAPPTWLGETGSCNACCSTEDVMPVAVSPSWHSQPSLSSWMSGVGGRTARGHAVVESGRSIEDAAHLVDATAHSMESLLSIYSCPSPLQNCSGATPTSPFLFFFEALRTNVWPSICVVLWYLRVLVGPSDLKRNSKVVLLMQPLARRRTVKIKTTIA